MVTKLDRELTGLATMPRDELVERWRAAYGCPPPAGARRELLLYAAGWNLQTRRLGSFPAQVRRMLRREVDRIRRECEIGRTVADSKARAGGERQIFPGSDPASRAPNDAKPPPSTPKPAVVRRTLVPGTRLLRDWNGKAHVVDVVENGYLHEGTTYRSLSAIARRITGAHWSGPRFFGL